MCLCKKQKITKIYISNNKYKISFYVLNLICIILQYVKFILKYKNMFILQYTFSIYYILK